MQEQQQQQQQQLQAWEHHRPSDPYMVGCRSQLLAAVLAVIYRLGLRWARPAAAQLF